MTSSENPYGLFLDIQTTQHLLYNRRGIPRYVANQAIALLRHPGLVRGVYFNPLRPFPDFLDEQLLKLPTLDWSTMRSFRRAAEQGPLAYYTMSPFETRRTSEAMLPPFAMKPEIPLVITMYDLIPLLRADKYLGDRNLAQEYYGRLELVRQADLILTISEHTRTDALNCLELDPKRLVNIGAGVSPYFRPATSEDRPEEILKASLPEIRKPFILSVSGAEERKNTEGLIEAFSLLPRHLRDELQLVIACNLNDHFMHLWNYKTKMCGLTPHDVVKTDLVADEVLRALYQKAELFAFASFYEGFGLVAAEAAACGCPSVLSNTSSMPEIFNFPPACFDPADPEDIADHMERALTDSAFNAELRRVAARTAPLHTWEAVADRTVAALKLLPEPADRYYTAPARRRVALVGPFPPVMSGIADFNQRLAAELAPMCDLDIYASIDFDPRKTAPGLMGVRKFSVEALGKILNPYAYDAVVYSFGNNQHHHRTYEKALEYPGIVWLHDVQLAGLFLSHATEKFGAGAGQHMAEMVARLYLQRTPHELAEPAVRQIEDYSRRGVFLTGELTDRARTVIVHSDYARHLLTLDQGPWACLPPTVVLPLPVPPGESPGGEMHETVPVLASFGILSAGKLPERIVDALAILRHETPVQLVFVGKVDAGFDLGALKDYIQWAGVGDLVTLTGELDPATYRSWLRRARCAVQLRAMSEGESSAAVADCLGSGIPVVTNISACAEMPAGTVEMVPRDVSGALLAEHIRRVLVDPDVEAGLVSSGLEWAADHTFRQTALDLLEIVGSLQLRPDSEGVTVPV